MKRKLVKLLSGAIVTFLLAGTISSMPVNAEGFTGWKTDENGNKFWYENDVKQGTEGRGKEIFDPGSNAWYWLDSIDGGKMAVSKDVYQESLAGDWGDTLGEDGKRYGKWVRYDEYGHMIKGWNKDDNGTYYFDPIYGTMAKGIVNIDGKEYRFNEATGILESGEAPNHNLDTNTNGWVTIDGIEYWYENGVRQGTEGRGKEIYDPGSEAWYWLDAIDNGKKAVSKDVYQESLAGDWGDVIGEDGKRYGKWVRYDEKGHMIKGWNIDENGTYYFDLIYGTMAKGEAVIDGKTYHFDVNTGILTEGEAPKDTNIGDTTNENPKDETTKDETTDQGEFKWVVSEVRNYDNKGILSSRMTHQYNDQGICIGTQVTTSENASVTYEYNDDGNLLSEVHISEGIEGLKTVCNYDEQGNLLESNTYNEGVLTSRITCCYEDGNLIQKITENIKEESKIVEDYSYAMDNDTKIVTTLKRYSNKTSTYKSVDKYDKNGNILIHESSNANGIMTDRVVYTYNDDGNLEKKDTYKYDSSTKKLYLFLSVEYEYDSYGNVTKYASKNSSTTIEYEQYNGTSRIVKFVTETGGKQSGYTYEYEEELIKKHTSYTDFWRMDYWEEYSYEGYTENCDAYTQIIQAYLPGGSPYYRTENDYQKIYLK